MELITGSFEPIIQESFCEEKQKLSLIEAEEAAKLLLTATRHSYDGCVLLEDANVVQVSSAFFDDFMCAAVPGRTRRLLLDNISNLPPSVTSRIDELLRCGHLKTLIVKSCTRVDGAPVIAPKVLQNLLTFYDSFDAFSLLYNTEITVEYILDFVRSWISREKPFKFLSGVVAFRGSPEELRKQLKTCWPSTVSTMTYSNRDVSMKGHVELVIDVSGIWSKVKVIFSLAPNANYEAHLDIKEFMTFMQQCDQHLRPSFRFHRVSMLARNDIIDRNALNSLTTFYENMSDHFVFGYRFSQVELSLDGQTIPVMNPCLLYGFGRLIRMVPFVALTAVTTTLSVYQLILAEKSLKRVRITECKMYVSDVPVNLYHVLYCLALDKQFTITPTQYEFELPQGQSASDALTFFEKWKTSEEPYFGEITVTNVDIDYFMEFWPETESPFEIEDGKKFCTVVKHECYDNLSLEVILYDDELHFHPIRSGFEIELD
ncbi:hypothetical protein QR680_014019 [Steinernema hermaphroditum]|uniref:Uncharacterized protein n=1 Tax=Steinernema hermaphroditum TaxID=289476 RepID=A0AA39I7F4_9BILA|nr:hypothetical protein QR680_014019 [Steinernema hermaphroditum]